VQEDPRQVPFFKEVIDVRPKPKETEAASLLFITKHGHKWERVGVSEPDPDTGKIKITNNAPVVQECIKLLKKLKLHRRGLGFCTLRHTFETVAGGAKDQVAVNALMGHVDDSMAANCREKIEDVRLEAVTKHVYKWLFPVAKKVKAK
jgi:integrase